MCAQKESWPVVWVAVLRFRDRTRRATQQNAPRDQLTVTTVARLFPVISLRYINYDIVCLYVTAW